MSGAPGQFLPARGEICAFPRVRWAHGLPLLSPARARPLETALCFPDLSQLQLLISTCMSQCPPSKSRICWGLGSSSMPFCLFRCGPSPLSYSEHICTVTERASFSPALLRRNRHLTLGKFKAHDVTGVLS